MNYEDSIKILDYSLIGVIHVPLLSSSGIICGLRGQAHISHGLILMSRVQQASLLAGLFACDCCLGVLVEAQKGQHENLIEDEGAKDQEDEAEELQHAEVLSLPVEFNDEEEDPDDDCPGGVDG